MSEKSNEPSVLRIQNDFENAIVYLDALNDYFIDTAKRLNRKKVDFRNGHKISARLMELLDNIYEIKSDKRSEFIESIQDEVLDGELTVKDVISISISDDGVVRYTQKEGYKDDKFNPKVAKNKHKTIKNHEMIFIRAILTNAVIIFEQFFRTQYTTLVLSQPKSYFEGRKILLSDIFEDNFSNILHKHITKEVESNMFDSLKALDRIKEKSQIDVDRYIPIRKQFEEVYYRRNSYVHSQGKANDMYFSSVDERFRKDMEIGSQLVCDDCYLAGVIATVYKIIASLHFEMLHYADAKPNDYHTLSDLGFAFLKGGNYELAEYIYGILRKEKSFDFASRAIYEVDYICALKYRGRDVSALLDKFDVSAMTPNFRIAKLCLLDAHNRVYDELIATYPNSFDAVAVRDWPIFKTFRETEYYTKFIELHKDDFETFLFEDDNTADEEAPTDAELKDGEPNEKNEQDTAC